MKAFFFITYSFYKYLINNKYRELQKLLNTYNVDLSECVIYYEYKDVNNNISSDYSSNINLSNVS